MIRGIVFRRDTEKQLSVCAHHATICILSGCILLFRVLKQDISFDFIAKPI